MIKVKYLVVGTGLCAKGFHEGLLSSCKLSNDDILFLQETKFSCNHYSCVPRRGGMANYWHRGLMSPGIDFFTSMNVDLSVVKTVDQFLGVPGDFHLGLERKMQILPKEKYNFFVQGDNVLFDSINSICKNGDVWVVECARNIIVCDELVIASGTVGSLEVLSKVIDVRHYFSEQRFLYFNDHFMAYKDSNSHHLNNNSSDWFESDNKLINKRMHFLRASNLILSSKVRLLTLPYIGKLIYGIFSPLFLIDFVFRKILPSQLKEVDFELTTPNSFSGVYDFSDNTTSIKSDSGTPAFHPLGCSNSDLIGMLSDIGITLLSGLQLPTSFRFFPSYTLFIISYNSGYLFQCEE